MPQAFYWGTSEWSAQEIEEAFRTWEDSQSSVHGGNSHDLPDVADKLNLIPPIAEQCLHQCVSSQILVFGSV